MFQEGLMSLLAGNSGIQAQLGTSRSDKTNGVFPQLAPDSPTYPYIVYTEIANEPVEVQQGMNRLCSTRMRIQCTAASYGGAKKLAEAIRQLLSLTAQYQGTLTDGTVLQNARQVPPGEVDDTEAVGHGRIYHTHLEWEFWYTNNS